MADLDQTFSPVEAPGAYYPQDFSLESINILTSSGQPFEMKQMLVELSYFEDMFKPATTGHILINDSIGFINNLKMNGTEKIRLEFNKTAKSSGAYGISKTFSIVRISERIRKNFNTETYSIHFCSQELLLSEQIKISKSYSGRKIDSIVQEILIEWLKSILKQHQPEVQLKLER